MLGEGHVGMGTELGCQLSILLAGDLPGTTRDGLGREGTRLRELLEVAIHRADAHAEHVGCLGFADT